MKKLDPEVKKMTLKQKQELLKKEMAIINKKFKREVVTFGSKKEQNRIPFKNKDLNEKTSGGVPCGKFTVIWGDKGSCKTTTCYELVAQAQQMGKICLWVDFERSYSKPWAALQGVNLDDLIYAPAFEDAESAMDTVIKLLETKAVDMVVIDSIQGMSPIGEQETKKHVEKSMADDTMALIAKKLSQFFRRSSFQVWESDCTFILIGQTRIQLGKFVALAKLSGGHALEHWSSMTIHVSRTAKDQWPHIMVKDAGEAKSHKEYTGFTVVATVDKSKVGPDEGKKSYIDFMYGQGMSDESKVKIEVESEEEQKEEAA